MIEIILERTGFLQREHFQPLFPYLRGKGEGGDAVAGGLADIHLGRSKRPLCREVWTEWMWMR